MSSGVTDDGIPALQPEPSSITAIVQQVRLQGGLITAGTGHLSKRVLKGTTRELGLWVDDLGESLRKQKQLYDHLSKSPLLVRLTEVLIKL